MGRRNNVGRNNLGSHWTLLLDRGDSFWGDNGAGTLEEE